jgi:hypothetical protein
MPTSVWIINLVVLGAVYEADLGHRKIAWFRLARPVVLAGIIVSLYLSDVVTSGNGLAGELALAGLGIVLGFAVMSLAPVSADGDRTAWSTAGWAYAAAWALIVGARLGFSFATSHSHPLQHWLATNTISSNAVKSALIFMAIAMLLTRTIGFAVRARLARNRVADVVRSRPGSVELADVKR